MFGMAELQFQIRGRPNTNEAMEALAEHYPLIDNVAFLFKTGPAISELWMMISPLLMIPWMRRRMKILWMRLIPQRCSTAVMTRPRTFKVYPTILLCFACSLRRVFIFLSVE